MAEAMGKGCFLLVWGPGVPYIPSVLVGAGVPIVCCCIMILLPQNTVAEDN